MERQTASITEYTRYSDAWFLNLYLKYGSVEKVSQHFMRQGDNLPISVAQYHRLVKRSGIVKGAGRKAASLGELMHFFTCKALEPDQALERIYKTFMPLDFETSVETLHRVHERIKRGYSPRAATALMITKQHDPDHILVGFEQSTKRRYGKHRGDLTVPMTFSDKKEEPSKSIMRVLQQEVWAQMAAEGNLNSHSQIAKCLVPDNLEPYMFLDILDVRVAVYHLTIPPEVNGEFFSHKIAGHHFMPADQLLDKSNSRLRWGIYEMVEGLCYPGFEPFIKSSDLNLLLAGSQ